MPRKQSPPPLKQKTLQDRVKQLRQRNLELREKIRGGKKFREQKVRFQNAQLSILERALQISGFEFNPKTREDLRTLQVELMHKHLDRKISPQDFALQTQGIGNLIKIMETTELQDEINELKQQAAIARRVLASKYGLEADHSSNPESIAAPAPRSSNVDPPEQDA